MQKDTLNAEMIINKVENF